MTILTTDILMFKNCFGHFLLGITSKIHHSKINKNILKRIHKVLDK